MKGATIKQVALNVTDRDKINIVSSQAVLEVQILLEFQDESCKF